MALPRLPASSISIFPSIFPLVSGALLQNPDHVTLLLSSPRGSQVTVQILYLTHLALSDVTIAHLQSDPCRHTPWVLVMAATCCFGSSRLPTPVSPAGLTLCPCNFSPGAFGDFLLSLDVLPRCSTHGSH